MIKENPFQPTIAEESIVTIELKKASIIGLSADAIESAFAPMVTRLREIEVEFDSIVNRPINDETIEMARDLRLKMVKVRTGTDKVHKEQKEEFLIKGRAVDAVKNVLHAAVIDKEKKLSEIENHFINIEKAAKLKLYNERVALLEPYIGAEAKMFPLGEMAQDSFDNLVAGYAAAAVQKKEQEVRDALAKKEAEEKKALEDRLIREENERLKNEQLVKDREAAAERQKIEDKLKKERLERKRLEDEAAEKIAKEEAERKANIAAERKAKRAPDKIKLLSLAEQIELLECLPLKDEEAQVILSNATDLLAKVVKYIKTNAEKL